MTTLTIQGSKRSINLTVDKIAQHPKVIKHWVNGGALEEYDDQQWVECYEIPSFDLAVSIRPMIKRPVAGEVWLDDNHQTAFLAGCNKTFQALNGRALIAAIDNEYPTGLIYLAPSIEAYFARKRLEAFNGAGPSIIKNIVDMARLEGL